MVPFSAGVHPGLLGPFVIYEFPDPADDDALYLENPLGDVISRDYAEEILRYREAFEDLRKLSFRPDGSLAYLDKTREGNLVTRCPKSLPCSIGP